MARSDSARVRAVDRPAGLSAAAALAAAALAAAALAAAALAAAARGRLQRDGNAPADRDTENRDEQRDEDPAVRAMLKRRHLVDFPV
jgi:ribosomal protein L12E/L44/L45/RPP1/RPP2